MSDSAKVEKVVFYRKYRPQTVSELDSSDVKLQLENILSSHKVPHALLFSGSRGTGKTSSARIIAKALNCTSPVSGFEPCNKCEACISITEGSNVDVIEIDAASNRGIDEIRDLREKIKLSPVSLNYKVYIIDEVHMLTNEAFNALLKTLEEPPAHAYFILCTTEVNKIPDTILSRCLRINFKRAKKDEVVHSLSRVVKGEKIEIDTSALQSIAKESDGSFRDAAQLLEQLSFGAKKITSADVLLSLGISQVGRIEDLLKYVFEKDVKKAIDFVDDAFSKGVDLKIVSVKILDYLRAILLKRKGVEIEDEVLDFGEVGEQDLFRLIELVSKAVVDYKNAVIPQLPLELAVIQWCGVSGGSVKGGEGQVDKVEKKKEMEEPVVVKEKEKKLEPVSVIKEEVVEKALEDRKDSKITLGDIKEKWAEILKGVKPHNHSVEAFLKASSPKEWDGRYLTLEVFYKFHKERLENDKCRILIEEVASSLVSEAVKIKFVLGDGKRVQAAPKIDENIIGAEPPNEVIRAAEEMFKGGIIE